METKNIFSSSAFLERLHLRDLAVFIFFALVTCPLLGQDKQKAELTPADYDLWSLPEIGSLKDDGKWLTYKISYANADTLGVKSTDGKVQHVFASGYNNRFVGQDYFTCQTKDSILTVLHLKTGNKQLLPKVLHYDVAGKFLILLRDQNGVKELAVSDLYGKTLFRDSGAYDFEVSPDRSAVLYSTHVDGRYSVKYIALGKVPKSYGIQTVADDKFVRLTWSKDSRTAAFFKFKEKASALCYFRFSDNKLVAFGPNEQGGFPDNRYIDTRVKIDFSADNKNLFIKMRQIEGKPPEPGNSDVQVWNAADKFLYSNEQIIRGWTMNPKLCLFETDSGHYRFLTDKVMPQGFLTADKRHVVAYNSQQYEPQPKLSGDADFYITNIKSGEQHLFLKKTATASDSPYLSNSGRYLFYFRDHHWFSYDVDTDAHKNLTSASKFPLHYIEYVDKLHSYGVVGLSAGEKELLFYDEFDLWAVNVKGGGLRRLTNGRERGIIFRVVPQDNVQDFTVDNRRFTLGFYALNDGIVLSGRTADNFKNGVFYLKDGQVKEIIFTDKRVTSIVKASEADSFAWIEESFTSPPMIVTAQSFTAPKMLLETNPQHKKYFAKEPVLIDYTANGKQLKGVLYYPTDYRPGKHYPMVVNIYEEQSKEIHKFLMPGLYNSEGFNICNLTAKGYFVLLPDIVYRTGYIGDSALECVEAAVASVIKNHPVDPKKVGVRGTSFGGFETNYIICKSSTFACAVAGAAPTDYVSFYLSEALHQSTPNYFKMEEDQGRMGGSLFDDTEAYLRNSPVLLASGVTTPLLAWTGLKDYHVHYTQSFEFYMALRRLGKEHILLAFPEEGHVLFDRKRDADLTGKMEQWFDYYLKDASKPAWMVPH